MTTDLLRLLVSLLQSHVANSDMLAMQESWSRQHLGLQEIVVWSHVDIGRP